MQVPKFATNASGTIWWTILQLCELRHLVVKFVTNASGILFSWRDNSSFRVNTLGPLCLWQCFFDSSQLSWRFHFFSHVLTLSGDNWLKNHSRPHNLYIFGIVRTLALTWSYAGKNFNDKFFRSKRFTKKIIFLQFFVSPPSKKVATCCSGNIEAWRLAHSSFRR